MRRGLARDLFGQITDACAALGIDLIGGHTEITLGIDRPVIAGAMLGEATAAEFVRGDDVAEGDAVLLTKGIAIEGTALLAREVPGALRDRGLSETMVARAVDLLFTPGISVVPDALALRAVTKPKLMHDPTEGDWRPRCTRCATRAGRELHVRADAVRVLDETRAVCGAPNSTRWGCSHRARCSRSEPGAAEPACGASREAGIECDVIGGSADRPGL
jgi:hydrogenase maturation factor